MSPHFPFILPTTGECEDDLQAQDKFRYKAKSPTSVLPLAVGWYLLGEQSPSFNPLLPDKCFL